MKFSLDTSLPITFDSIEQMADERFVKGKIWICHTGENRNRSSFSKEVLQAAIPSLANIPVLGFIQVDNNNETDFAGHEQRIVIDSDGARIEYLGRMYGIVPESNNAQFEMKLCDDGVEREFLTAEVLLHKKFPECIEIVQREGIHSHSMELYADSIQGSFNKNGVFDFSSFLFEALCLLGESVVPAMINSSLELFAQYNYNDELNDLLREFNSKFSDLNPPINTTKVRTVEKTYNEWECPHCNNSIGEKELYYEQDTSKWFHRPCLHVGEIQFSDDDKNIEHFKQLSNQGGEKVDEKLELFTKFPTLKEEDVADFKANIENYTLDELETKLNELFESQKVKENEEKQPDTSFSFTAQQLKDELRLKLADFKHTDRWGDEYRQYWYIDHDENRVYAEDGQNSYLPVGINYDKNGDAITIDIETKKRIKWTPEDLEDGAESVVTLMSAERSEYDFNKVSDQFTEQKGVETQKVSALEESLNAKVGEFETLKTEFESLKGQFEEVNAKYSSKIERETEEKFNSLFESFTKELSDEEMVEIKNLKASLTYEEIETKLFALVGKKKAKFSYEPTKKPFINLEPEQKQKKTSGKSYDELFEKYNG